MKTPQHHNSSLLLLPSHTYTLLQYRSNPAVLHKPFQHGIFHRLQSSKINPLLCGLSVGHSAYRKYSSSPTYCLPASQYFSLVLTDDSDIIYLSFCTFHSNKIRPTNSSLSASEHTVPFRTSLGKRFYCNRRNSVSKPEVHLSSSM